VVSLDSMLLVNNSSVCRKQVSRAAYRLSSQWVRHMCRAPGSMRRPCLVGLPGAHLTLADSWTVDPVSGMHSLPPQQEEMCENLADLGMQRKRRTLLVSDAVMLAEAGQ
jgi:hypothetical protein